MRFLGGRFTEFENCPLFYLNVATIVNIFFNNLFNTFILVNPVTTIETRVPLRQVL